MRLPPRTFAPALIAAIALAAGPAPTPAQDADDEWQLVLLKPPGCNPCSFAEEVLRRRGFVQRAELTAGGNRTITARVVRRPTGELTPQEAAEVAALPYIDASQWALQASFGRVLLERDGHVMSAGILPDSGDPRRAQLPSKVLLPDASGDPVQMRFQLDEAYRELYLRSWNFDYFYELALDPRFRESRSMEKYIAARPAPQGPALPARNVVLQSTATWPGNNEIFNATRIAEIRDTVQGSLGVPASNVSILYGGGNPSVPNAVEVQGNRLAFTHFDIPNARPATLPNVAALFQTLERTPGSRNLFVLVGHGSPEGAGLWGHLGSLSPADLATLHAHGGGDDVLVSGNCFGGVMARAMSCGFFAARPDIVATGCQADALQVAESRDYLKMFFASVTADEKPRADADGDGTVSFEEAHWFASAQGDIRNVTYTTLDAFADDWFAAHPQELPEQLTVRELRQLAAGATPAERQAVHRMTDGLTADIAFSLRDLAGQATAWSQQQAGVRPMIAQLARRVLYVQRHAAGDAGVAAVRACESRSIAKFVAP